MKPANVLALLVLGVLTDLASAQSLVTPLQTPLESTLFGRITLFVGPPAGVGSVQVIEEHTGMPVGAPEALQGIELLPIDCVGRTVLQELLADRARLRTDVPAGRLSLPFNRGSLYRYKRTDSNGSANFGFFVVLPGGGVRTTFELPGTGPGNVDPWVARIAVDPRGVAILAASTLDAGGDLYEISLKSGRPILRTAGQAPIAFSDAGLWLGVDWAFGIGDDGAYRFDRSAGSTASLVPTTGGPAPTWFSGEAVMSPNRRWAVTTAGSDPTLAFPWVFRRSGAARRVGTAMQLTGAGFLPEIPEGPLLAVSNDGGACGYCSAGVPREVFLAEVPPLPMVTTAPVQLSQDMYFADTLDSIGGLTFYTVNRLLLAVGSVGDPTEGGIENADFFTAELTAGGPDFVNLTQSSGELVLPFWAIPEITPEKMHALPNGAVLVHDGDAEKLLGFTPGQPSPTLLLDSVKELDFAEVVGNELVVAVRRDFQPRPREIHRLALPLNAPSTLAVQGTPDTLFVSPVVRAETLAFVHDEEFVGQTLNRLHVPTSQLSAFPLPPGALGSALGFTPSGSVTFTTLLPHQFLVWPGAGAPVTLQANPANGMVLPAH